MNDRRILRDAARLRLILFQGTIRRNRLSTRENPLRCPGLQKRSALRIAGFPVRREPPERDSEPECFRGRFRGSPSRKTRRHFPAADGSVSSLLVQKYSLTRSYTPSDPVMKTHLEKSDMQPGKRDDFIGIILRFQALENHLLAGVSSGGGVIISRLNSSPIKSGAARFCRNESILSVK